MTNAIARPQLITNVIMGIVNCKFLTNWQKSWRTPFGDNYSKVIDRRLGGYDGFSRIRMTKKTTMTVAMEFCNKKTSIRN